MGIAYVLFFILSTLSKNKRMKYLSKDIDLSMNQSLVANGFSFKSNFVDGVKESNPRGPIKGSNETENRGS